MKELSVFIVEDELLVSEELAGLILRLGYEVIGVSDEPADSVSRIVKDRPDILFMDVNLNGTLDGVDVVKTIQEVYDPVVIFLTAYSDDETLDRIRTTKPDAYINKPFEKKSLEMAIDIAVSKLEERQSVKPEQTEQGTNDYFFLKVKNRYERVRYDEVLYIEADGSYARIHLLDRVIILSSNLKSIHERVNRTEFIRVHRKFVVNATKITSFDDSYVWLGDNSKQSIPVSDSHKEALLAFLNLI